MPEVLRPGMTDFVLEENKGLKSGAERSVAALARMTPEAVYREAVSLGLLTVYSALDSGLSDELLEEWYNEHKQFLEPAVKAKLDEGVVAFYARAATSVAH